MFFFTGWDTTAPCRSPQHRHQRNQRAVIHLARVPRGQDLAAEQQGNDRGWRSDGQSRLEPGSLFSEVQSHSRAAASKIPSRGIETDKAARHAVSPGTFKKPFSLWKHSYINWK